MGHVLNGDKFRTALPSLALAADLIPSGWEVVEDVEPTLKSASDLDFVSFLEPNDGGCVYGVTMRKRAKIKKANLGLADLKVVLTGKANVSVEVQPYRVAFSGTLLRNPHGFLCVAYVYWSGGFTVMLCRRVTDDWDGSARLARCK